MKNQDSVDSIWMQKTMMKRALTIGLWWSVTNPEIEYLSNQPEWKWELAEWKWNCDDLWQICVGEDWVMQGQQRVKNSKVQSTANAALQRWNLCRTKSVQEMTFPLTKRFRLAEILHRLSENILLCSYSPCHASVHKHNGCIISVEEWEVFC